MKSFWPHKQPFCKHSQRSSPSSQLCRYNSTQRWHSQLPPSHNPKNTFCPWRGKRGKTMSWRLSPPSVCARYSPSAPSWCFRISNSAQILHGTHRGLQPTRDLCLSASSVKPGHSLLTPKRSRWRMICPQISIIYDLGSYLPMRQLQYQTWLLSILSHSCLLPGILSFQIPSG